MIKHLLTEFGMVYTNEIPAGASYLFPDGEFLSCTENYNRGLFKVNRFRTGIHPDIDLFAHQNNLIPPGMRNCLLFTDNALKLQDGSVLQQERIYVVLPPEEPTAIQYEKLEDWLFSLHTNKRTMDVSTCHDTFYRVYDFYKEETGLGYTPTDIIKEIKKIYNKQ